MTMTMTVRPIRPDLPFGARIGGITLDALRDEAVRAELIEAFEQYGLLIFEGVDPTPQMQVALSQVFGPLKDHPSKAVARAGDSDVTIAPIFYTRQLPVFAGEIRQRVPNGLIQVDGSV